MTGKVYIKTFGCQMNEYDSAKMADVLAQAEGLEQTANPEQADVILFKNIGFGGEFAWKGGRGTYQGVQPYRPFFYDFNAIYALKLADRTYMEFLAGLGSESTRYYQPFQTCDFYTCKNYVTINHFMGHFGVGLKLYPARNFFVRPEAHLYLVHDNQEFSSGRAVRYGISIGYTFGQR